METLTISRALAGGGIEAGREAVSHIVGRDVRQLDGHGVASAAIEVSSLGETFACKAISDRENISEKIDKMGVKVEYVGTIISDYVKQGYVPMVW